MPLPTGFSPTGTAARTSLDRLGGWRQRQLNGCFFAPHIIGLRYAYFVRDGNSAYRSVRRIYGADREVVKYKCINHVGKGMGTRLCKLKRKLTKPATTCTERVMRRSLLARLLTNKNIDNLSRFYMLALTHSVNISLETMRKNALASF